MTNRNAMNAPRPEVTSNVQLGRLASEDSGTHHNGWPGLVSAMAGEAKLI